MATSYTAKDILVLEGLEPAGRRADAHQATRLGGMYVGLSGFCGIFQTLGHTQLVYREARTGELLAKSHAMSAKTHPSETPTIQQSQIN